LHCFGISVTVKVDLSVDCLLLVEGGEVVLYVGGLTSTGGTDVEHTSLLGNVGILKEVLSGGLSCWDDQVAEETFVLGVERLNLLRPVDKGGGDWVEVVVEALKVTLPFEEFS
jgi:hypothetical protein